MARELGYDKAGKAFEWVLVRMLPKALTIKKKGKETALVDWNQPEPHLRPLSTKDVIR